MSQTKAFNYHIWLCFWLLLLSVIITINIMYCTLMGYHFLPKVSIWRTFRLKFGKSIDVLLIFNLDVMGGIYDYSKSTRVIFFFELIF